MPELVVHRTRPAPPPMVCMYCGAAATSTTEWRETNRPSAARTNGGSGGTDLTTLPTGDDPVSAVIAVIMLPVVLWELLVALVTGVAAVVGRLSRPRPAAAPPPEAKELPTTRVVVTACDRHRRFRDRFVWAGVTGGVALVALWVWAVRETGRVMGTENVGLAVTLMIGAVFATVLLPLALTVWYAFGGPVAVGRVTEDAVVLDRVRPAYFDAVGRPTAEAA